MAKACELASALSTPLKHSTMRSVSVAIARLGAIALRDMPQATQERGALELNG
jgi:hypothetical protein